MVGILDYRPIRVPDGAVELRVHGVSGTPPEALLKESAVLVAGTPTAGFHRHEPSSEPMTATSPGVREGYAWGGLTSGTRITSALRLLLLPFSLVNVAGWMVPGVSAADGSGPTVPETASKSVMTHGLVARLLALSLTASSAFGALWLALIATPRIVERYELTILGDVEDQARAALSSVVLLILAWNLIALRRAKVPAAAAPPPEAQACASKAPVMATTEAGVDISMLWRVPRIRGRLSAGHAATALACASLATMAAVGPEALRVAFLPWLAWATVALTILGLVALLKEGETGGSLADVLPRLALGLGIVTVVLTLWLRVTGASPQRVLRNADRFLADGLAYIALAVFVLVFVQVLSGPRGGPLVGRLYASSFTVVGFATAFTGIAGLAAIIAFVFHGEELTSDELKGDVVVLAGLIAIVGVVAITTVLVIVILQLNVTDHISSVAGFARLRSAVANARGAIVAGASVFAVGANAAAVYYWIHLRGPEAIDPVAATESWASGGWFVIAAVVAAVFAARASRWAVRVTLTVVGSAVIVAIAGIVATLAVASLTDAGLAEARDQVLRDSDSWFVLTALAAIVIAPMAAVVVYVGWGSKDQGLRRTVGVFWDLVDFWPRQFHPWAPPPYTDTTIPELADRVSALARSSGASRVIVSAHSQGAIIAIPALGRIRDDVNEGRLPANAAAKICLLTYGQLLDAHYRWLFPWVFNPSLFAEVDDFLGGRWINLHRITDPLGHPVKALADIDAERDLCISANLQLNVGSTSKAKTLNHGDYWYSGEFYQPALDKLAGTTG